MPGDSQLSLTSVRNLKSVMQRRQNQLYKTVAVYLKSLVLLCIIVEMSSKVLKLGK